MSINTTIQAYPVSHPYSDTSYVSHPLGRERQWNKCLNELSTVVVIGSIGGGLRVVYGTMKCALSALQYLKAALQKKDTTIAATRFREGCHQIAKGLIEVIPLIGTIWTSVIHSDLNDDLVNEGVRLVKEGQIDKAIALEERILSIPTLRTDNFGPNLGFLVFGRIYNQTVKTHPEKAKEFANRYQTTWFEAYEHKTYSFQEFVSSSVSKKIFLMNIVILKRDPKYHINRKLKGFHVGHMPLPIDFFKGTYMAFIAS